MSTGQPDSQRNVVQHLLNLHRHLVEAKSELQRLPKSLAQREAEYQRAVTQSQQEKENLKRYRVETDQKELELKTNDKRLIDLQIKLNQCKSKEEYAAIQTEMTNFRNKNSTLEDEIFERLNSHDQMTKDHAAKAQDLTSIKTDLDKFKEQCAYTIDKLTKRVAGMQARVKEWEAKLDDDIATSYHRNLKNKGNPGFAECDASGCCENCYVEQTLQLINEVNAGRIAKCGNCGFLLYRPDPAQPDPDAEES